MISLVLATGKLLALAAPLLLVAAAALVAARGFGGGARKAEAPAASAPASTPRRALAAAAALAALLFALLAFAARRAPAAPPTPPTPPPATREPPRAPPPAVFTPKYLNATQTSGPWALDFACVASDGTPLTCAPSFCASSSAVVSSVSTPTCAFTSAAIDFAAQVARVQCRTCTVPSAALPVCTAAFQSALFGKFPGVKAAYCNDRYFVLHSDQSGPGSYNLDEVPFPPGGTAADGTPCRTRSGSVTAHYSVAHFPLYPSLLPSADPTNNINSVIFPGGANGAQGGYLQNGAVSYGLSNSGGVGSTISGQEMYPVFNNRASLTPESCEIDACNEHVGQGGGQPHLHGDPFGPSCLYSSASYTNATTGAKDVTVHPPLIGFGLDGVFVYGRHLSTSAPGYATALDVCGGHTHGSYGYHYHAQLIVGTTDGRGAPGIATGLTFPASTPGVYKCFRGNLSADPYFGSKASFPAAPCCGSTEYYAGAGIAISGAVGQNVSAVSPAPAIKPASAAAPAAASAAAAALAAAAIAALLFSARD